jgi:hypothetical protein
MPEGREALFRRSLAVLAVLLLLTEALVRWRAPSLWSDPALTETPSAPLLHDRIQALAQAPGKRVLFLGDSVAYGSALREKGDADWREHTPVAALRRRLKERGIGVVSLAADGLYPQDLEALYRASRALSPSAVVLELNYRMLSAEAGDSRTALSRPYLAPWLQEAQRPPRAWDDSAADGLRRAWATWRYMELVSGRALQPSVKERLAPLAAALFPAPLQSEDDQDAKDALLDLKIRPYYQAPGPSQGHLGWQALGRLAEDLKADGIPVLVFLTPQNLERVQGLLDAQAFKANRAALAAAFKAPPASRLRYADWAQRKSAGRFLDHCHLDAAGNEGLAVWIMEALDADR